MILSSKYGISASACLKAGSPPQTTRPEPSPTDGLCFLTGRPSFPTGRLSSPTGRLPRLTSRLLSLSGRPSFLLSRLRLLTGRLRFPTGGERLLTGGLRLLSDFFSHIFNQSSIFSFKTKPNEQFY